MSALSALADCDQLAHPFFAAVSFLALSSLQYQDATAEDEEFEDEEEDADAEAEDA